MKFFDYKILLLLGLTIVIYFIYKEIENIRTRITAIENEIKNKPTLENKHDVVPENKHDVVPENKHDVVPENKHDVILTTNIQTIPTKIINVDMFSTTTHTNDNLKKTSVSSRSSSRSSSSKHLAIYSNDNEPYELTQNSLLESLKFDYNDKLKSDKSHESSEIFNNISNFDILIPNMEHQVVEVTLSDSIVETTSDNQFIEANVQNELVEATTSDQVIGSAICNQVVETTSDIHVVNTLSEQVVESNIIEQPKYTKEHLDKLKIPELKKIAESKKIPLSYKSGKQQKLKNKQELINEILL